MITDDLHIGLVQSSIVWKNREENLEHFGKLLQRVKGQANIAVLPEAFTTGFTMEAEQVADTMEGPTLQTVQSWAADYQLAIVGSFIIQENRHYFNRAFFATPKGGLQLYDKRHLFRMAGENRHFTAGEQQIVVAYKGWNICLQICYDLRFPVWSRNVNNAYDLLIYVANWPKARQNAWKTLLPARAIENLAYVCGVNRTGTDGLGIAYCGGSALYSPKGEKLLDVGKQESVVRTCTLSRSALDCLRTKFPAWKDADQFVLLNES